MLPVALGHPVAEVSDNRSRIPGQVRQPRPGQANNDQAATGRQEIAHPRQRGSGIHMVQRRHAGDQAKRRGRERVGEEVATHVGEAIETLALSRRTVVRLYLAGYDREEIATMLDWSEAKTRNLLYRGLTDLRARLRALGVGPGETR